MRIASVVARYLAGVIFLVMGLNGFLHFIPFPPGPPMGMKNALLRLH
jgi:putative oxidoreductase